MIFSFILSAPSTQHWFGTNILGDDIFLKCLCSAGIEILTVIAVLFFVYFLAIIIGSLISFIKFEFLREFFLNFLYYWITLPILLLAIFFLILFGASQLNVILALIFILVPSQSLFVYSALEEEKKESFVAAKLSIGFSRPAIFFKYLIPSVKSKINSYAFSRIPEIIIMDLSLNFFGLGIQPPKTSFGIMLFDGLSFMFSAWWLWAFPIITISAIFVSANVLASKFTE